jgi:GT2 family glycosyltransferase
MRQFSQIFQDFSKLFQISIVPPSISANIPSINAKMEKNTQPSTTASIVTWNHAGCIEACVTSLLRQTSSPAEIFIYDNASVDGTREILDRFKDRATLFYSPGNRGFCVGHNVAISRTRGDFVLLVNPDVVLRQDYIEKAARRMVQDRKIGTVCGLLLQNGLDLKSCLIDGAGLMMERSRRFLLRYHGVSALGLDLQSEEVFGADGALPFYRREMIENISVDGHFFDEMFFAHKEDHDISWRAQNFGWKTVFDPDCVAMHPRVFRPGDLQVRKQLAPDLKYHAVKNDLLLLLKNESGPDFARNFLHIVPRRIGIFFYAMFRERHSLNAYWFVVRNFGRIWRARRQVQRRSGGLQG